MACMHAFWWNSIYLHLTIYPGKDILVPEGPNISFPHNFIKNYLFPKIQVVSDSDRRDISKDPIKIQGLRKNALALIISLTHQTWGQVTYNRIFMPTILWKYAVKQYHTYIIHPWINRTDATTIQHHYWPNLMGDTFTHHTPERCSNNYISIY